jgi:radical SAM protein with 4Fe4S-binding SPASM domain
MAGSIFGIIEANGEVRPCEILDKPLGNVRDFGLNFMDLWQSQKARSTKDWIKDSKCNCHYDCAWSFNILANKKYQLELFSSLLKS